MNNFESYIKELNGYLHSLRRLRGPGYFYTARFYSAASNVDQFLSETVSGWGEHGEFQYKGKSEIEFAALQERLTGIIFRGALNLENIASDKSKANIKKMVIEDINEYYGLASTSLDSNGVFHPLIAGPVFELDIRNDNYFNLFCYLVQIGNYYVLTSFTRRKPKQ